MPNRRRFDPIGGFNFKVEIEGVTTAAFKECDGLTAETTVITGQSGLSLIERKRPGRTKYANLVLKRGYLNNADLWNWRKQVLDGKVQRRSGAIILCADDGTEVMRFNFFDAWPSKWKSLSLKGKGSELTVEEIELAFERLERA